MINTILEYNVMTQPWPLADESVDCCVTSPPYFGLRNYGVAEQIGMEESLDEYIQKMVSVFDEVWRVMKPQGTLWLNLGDSYARSPSSIKFAGGSPDLHYQSAIESNKGPQIPKGLKPKDLIGMPWEVALALRRKGWYLRTDIIWNKKVVMPEPVKDRPTRSHEFIFLLSKSPKYYYDYKAIQEKALYDVDGTGTQSRKARQHSGNNLLPDELKNGIRPAGFKNPAAFAGKNSDKQRGHSRHHDGFNDRWDKAYEAHQLTGMRNKRDVWTVAPAQFPEAHFATFPEELIRPCILAGCPVGGTVLDPFMGAGTTAKVALEQDRNFIGMELNPKYIKMAYKRIDLLLRQGKIINHAT